MRPELTFRDTAMVHSAHVDYVVSRQMYCKCFKVTGCKRKDSSMHRDSVDVPSSYAEVNETRESRLHWFKQSWLHQESFRTCFAAVIAPHTRFCFYGLNSLAHLTLSRRGGGAVSCFAPVEERNRHKVGERVQSNLYGNQILSSLLVSLCFDTFWRPRGRGCVSTPSNAEADHNRIRPKVLKLLTTSQHHPEIHEHKQQQSSEVAA